MSGLLSGLRGGGGGSGQYCFVYARGSTEPGGLVRIVHNLTDNKSTTNPARESGLDHHWSAL